MRTLRRLAVSCVALSLAHCGGSGGSSPTGRALRFEAGRYAFVNAAAFKAAIGAGGFTVEAWVKPDSVNDAYLQGIAVGQDLSTGSRSWGLFLEDLVDGQLSARVYVSPAAWSTAKGPVMAVEAGAWTHVAMTWNGVGIRAFKNGVEVGSTPQGGSVLPTDILHIGVWPGEAGFKGLIDELRVWSVPRTDQQIAANRGFIVPPREPGLVGYWRFEEPSGQSLLDSSVLGSTGTLGIGPLVDMADPERVDGGAPVVDKPIV